MASSGEKAPRLVFPGFYLGWDDPEQAFRLVELGVGGFCLYGGTVAEIADLTARLQDRAGGRLLFCADYEDGLASHVAGGTQLPSSMGLGAAGDEELAFEKGRITGTESRAMGVGWVFAPLLDLANRPENPIVNTRSFGSNPGLVSRLAGAYMKGLRAGGVLSCAKHFPGHGDTGVDSHLSLPEVRVERSVLAERELAPYKALQDVYDSVMIGHLAVPALEQASHLPATLSASVVNGVLRGELGFGGLVVTDAMNMGAITERFPEPEACESALLAGCDVILVPCDPEKLVYALMRRAEEPGPLAGAVEASCARLDAARGKLAAVAGSAPCTALELVGGDRHRGSALRIAQRCLAWVRVPAGPLPDAVRYFEPDAGFPGEVQGSAFVSRLRELGFKVEVGAPEEKGGCVVAGLFLSPRAYSGRIRYDDEESGKLRAVMADAGSVIAVSFGSPWSLDGLDPRAGALCAFSGCEASQRAAALVLAGKLEASGRLPVTVFGGTR